MLWLLGVCAAFASSYIMALRNLQRAVKNFDLSPGTLVTETNKILLSMLLGPLITVSVLWVGSAAAKSVLNVSFLETSLAVVAVVVSACFVAGIMPEVALRYIVQRDKLKNF